jgi:drug/metabolite transporter (DMT)-like permease
MTSSAATSAQDSRVARGIGFALLSYACFSTADAMVKLSSAHFSVFQIAFTLSVFALMPVLVLTRGHGGLRALRPTLPKLVLMRALLTSACALLVWQAFGMMPLADGYAILFASPILVTALSVPLLGEQVGWRRWAASGVGFLGVLIMIRPDFATVGLGHLFVLLGAGLGALSFIVLRKMGPHEKSAPILFSLFFTIALVTAPFAFTSFVMPTAGELFVLAMAGLLQGAGQTGLVLATRDAPAVIVAPFQYSQMLWAVLFGVTVFGDSPAPVLFLGLGIVVVSGLYTLWRETVRRRPVTLTLGRGEVPARAAR